MFRLFSTQSISVATAAALVGGFAAYLTPVQSQASMETQREAGLQRPHIKGRPSAPAGNRARMLFGVLAEL